jgi:transposase
MSDDRERQLLDENARLRQENDLLRERINLILKKLFGSSSEKLDPAQLELLLDPDAAKKAPAADGQEDVPAAEPEAPKVASKRSPRDLSNLEVREEVIVPEPVKANPDGFRQIDEVVTDRFDYQPAKIFIKRTVRPVFVPRKDPDAVPIKAPAPPTIAPGLLATPELIAHVLVAKYCDHLPLYRQEMIFRSRFGVELRRNTLCNWVSLAADALEPIYKLIHAGLLERNYLQADETPVRYLDPGRGKCGQGYFWVLRGPPPPGSPAGDDIFFQWHPSRAASCLEALLGPDLHAVLQVDGYNAYVSHAAPKEGIMLISCWSHARRKFTEALDAGYALAAGPIAAIAKLYQIETDLRKSGASDEQRLAVRQAEALPLLATIKRDLIALRERPEVLPKGALGKAVTYTLVLWERLLRYTSDGRLEIDNNGIENAIRPIAVGRNNWLFVGGEETGQRSAILFTLLENAKRHGHNPEVYLADVLTRLATMTTRDDLGQLLPSRWTPASAPVVATADHA